jgi:hypothetical protein
MEMKTREFLKASWKFGSYPDSMQANLSTLFQVLLDLRDQNTEILRAVKEKPINIPPRPESGESAFKKLKEEIENPASTAPIGNLFNDALAEAKGRSETKGGI